MPDSTGVILLYHGVTDTLSNGIENFSGKHMNAQEFERQIRFISQKCTPMSLRTIAKLLESGHLLPPRSVAVTFDDTFKNVRTLALPILIKYNVPATFFISTGFVGNGRRFWVDKVEHILNLCKHKFIRLDFEKKSLLFHLTNSKEKIIAVRAAKSIFKRLKPAYRDQVIDSLIKATGITDNGDSVSNYTNMDWEDVRMLDRPPLFEVGGHTVNHEILSYLTMEEVENEIRGCIEELELQLGHLIDLFSYPEGQIEHYNESVIKQLKVYGIKICPTAIVGTNRIGENPFHLKRIMAGFMGISFPFQSYLSES
ncbi:MAG: polysaccharide deacetylase family protein [Desulfobacterales bacterium]|nr:polysaccharide deacetylase family protein [Desulfobacterales bacterium]